MDNILIVALSMLRMFISFVVYPFIIFLIFMAIQLISYRLFNFNIYKTVMKKLFN